MGSNRISDLILLQLLELSQAAALFQMRHCSGGSEANDAVAMSERVMTDAARLWQVSKRFFASRFFDFARDCQTIAAL